MTPVGNRFARVWLGLLFLAIAAPLFAQSDVLIERVKAAVSDVYRY